MGLFLKTDQPFPKDIPALTSLRFYMVLVVVYHHVLTANISVDLPINLLSRGYLGVDFFFLLSGFILAHTYANKFARHEISKKTFYVRRLSRIYPLHLVMLLLCSVTAHLGLSTEYPGNTGTAFISNITMTHAWSGLLGPNYNTPSWSISAEWFAYLCMPFLLPFFYKNEQRPKLIIIISIAGIFLFNGLSFLLFAKPITHLTYDWGILRIIPEFFMGISLYFLSRKFKLAICNNYILVISCLCCASLTWITHSDIPIILSFAAIIVICANQSRTDTSNFLNTPGSVWLGNISYALYMVHIPIMSLFLYIKPKLLESPPYYLDIAMYMVAMPVVALLAAIFSHYAIEVPAQRYIRKLGQN